MEDLLQPHGRVCTTPVNDAVALRYIQGRGNEGLGSRTCGFCWPTESHSAAEGGGRWAPGYSAAVPALGVGLGVEEES